MLLTASAGAVNTVAFLACERFVAHVTGTVTRLGLSEQASLFLDYALVLGCFIFGAMASVLALNRRHYAGKRPFYAAPLAVVVILLTLTAWAGANGAFGPFGGDGTENRLFLALLAFAMGLQNAAVATSTGQVVRTTHLTGPATDLGVQLGCAAFTFGDQRRMALREATLRAGKIVAFTVGVVVAVPTAFRFGYLAFVLPALLVLVSTVMSFTSRRGLSTSVSAGLDRRTGRQAPSS